MNTIVFELFPSAKRKALSISCDDGRDHDRKLVACLNRYGLRGTFNLNSGCLGKPGYLKPEEIATLFRGHEVSTHSVTHPYLPHLSREGVVEEVYTDRKNLEALVGYPVRGHAYPGCGFNTAIVDMLPSLGIEYARTCECTGAFDLPDDFLRWRPSASFGGDLLDAACRFRNLPPLWSLQHLLVFGHSTDFARDESWARLEEFCSLMKQDPGVWAATMMEVVDYLSAVRRVKSTADGSVLHNPSAISVWATVNGQPTEIGAGETIRA